MVMEAELNWRINANFILVLSLIVKERGERNERTGARWGTWERAPHVENIERKSGPYTQEKGRKLNLKQAEVVFVDPNEACRQMGSEVLALSKPNNNIIFFLFSFLPLNTFSPSCGPTCHCLGHTLSWHVNVKLSLSLSLL